MIKKFSTIFSLLFISCLVLSPIGNVYAETLPERPGIANHSIDKEMVGSTTEGAVSATMSLATTETTSGCYDVFQYGGDRLADLQNDDGGWDWPLDDGDSTNNSPLNTIGPIAMGLSYAYLHTADPDHLDSLVSAGVLLLAKTNNFSPSDGYLAAKLDEILGGTTYTDHVVANFYGPLATTTYDRNGAGTLYDTAGYVNLIRTARANQGIPNLAAWDIGMGLVGAASVGADIAPWIAGVKAEIDELDGNAYYDVIGLAGAVYGLAFVGEDFDPTAGQHAAAGSLDDLADILAGYQIDGGGFTWNMNYLNPGEDNETIQETAYAILALNAVDRDGYYSTIQGASSYMESVQLTTGGWENYTGSGENNEITGEALWGISVGLPGPITSNVVADPNPAAIKNPVFLSAQIDNSTNGCSNIGSAEYSIDEGGWISMDPSDEAFDSMFEGVEASFTPPELPGIYDICVRGTDVVGNTGNSECIMLVVYDPDGGFVTGGGWIDSPAGAAVPTPDLVWDQGFETGTDGWYDVNSDWYGLVTQVPSGSDDVTSSQGNYHAVFEGNASSGPFSSFDAYRDVWPGTWVAEIDVYLDPAWAVGQGFDYTVAASGSDGAHQRDYIFHVTKDTSTGKLLVAGSNNTNFVPREDLENINHYEVTVADWFTLQHVFYNQDGALAVDLNLLDVNGNVLFTETRYNAADLIPDEVGGNRYSWFTFINVVGGIHVDEHQLNMPVSPTGKATFGFVSKYKKGADVPTGNTEFQFKAGNLNFHSTSYDWLVVTGSDYAKFKGVGTINGEGEYKFQLWAGDNEPDTFRIKIWTEDEYGVETVVYDNGMDQEIGGGNIVVHTK